MTIMKQCYGSFFVATFFGLVALDAVSFFTLHSVFESAAFVLGAILIVGVAIKYPEWLFPVALAEVISTSNGHSLNIELFGASIGVRMILFAVLLCATLVRCARHRKMFLSTPWLFILALVGTVLALGVAHGIVAGYDGNYFITSAKVEQGNSGGTAILVKDNCLLGIPTFAQVGKIEALARILDISTIFR